MSTLGENKRSLPDLVIAVLIGSAFVPRTRDYGAASESLKRYIVESDRRKAQGEDRRTEEQKSEVRDQRSESTNRGDKKAGAVKLAVAQNYIVYVERTLQARLRVEGEWNEVSLEPTGGRRAGAQLCWAAGIL